MTTWKSRQQYEFQMALLGIEIIQALFRVNMEQLAAREPMKNSRNSCFGLLSPEMIANVFSLSALRVSYSSLGQFLQHLV